MRLSARARFIRILAAAGLTAAVILPGASTATAADDNVLRLGVLQDLDSSNPFTTYLVVGYEAFELTYEQLVGFDSNLEPAPAYATSWERNADGKSWTFKFPAGKKWSDGQPATSADACFSWQLALDAIAADSVIGYGYLDPALGPDGARVSKVECPDPETMIAYTDDASNRILQSYIPILPKHIWGGKTYTEIGDDKFDLPKDGSGLVGSGPYPMVAWNVGDSATFKKNPNFLGTNGAEDEIVFKFFSSNDTMVQALKAGEIDYARTVSPDQFKALASEPDIKTVNGRSNGWTELGFNTYGTGTGKTIKDGGPSTKALLDPKFRDALGYAIDKQELVDRVIGGFGEIGSTQIPPVMSKWHTDPATPREFNIELAKQKLTDAGYNLDASGNRLDKELKPISLRLVMPDSDANLAKSGQFIVDWFGQLGIKVTPQVYESGALGTLMLPPEGDPPGTAPFDMFIWTWSWGPDPNDPLGVFLCNAIGSSSDSFWCDPEYDKLYAQQLVAKTDVERKAIIDQMQAMWYEAAPYHVLYYDDNLHAYRTDKYSNWQNQPGNGTPLFSYSVLGETLLKPFVAAPTPGPSATAGASQAAVGSSAPSASPGTDTGSPSSSSSPPILPIAIVGALVIALGAVFLSRRRTNAAADADDDE